MLTRIIASAASLGSPALAAAADRGGILPPAASNHARDVDSTLNFINGVTVFFFVLIIALMVYFAWRYRRREPAQRAEAQTSHNTALEMSWTLPPLVIVLVMFWFGFTGYMQLATPDVDDPYEVRVTGSQWSWKFTHPNGATTVDELHIPAGEAVQLTLNSTDVLHSLFIPDFRVKKDVVPGRYTSLWFRADEPTAYHASEDEQLARRNGHFLFCAEYCGTDHSGMTARVVVHEEGWRPEAVDFGEGPSLAKGEHLFQTQQCVGCHQTDPGKPDKTGPTFAGGIMGEERQLASGETVTVDENYIRNSILDPRAEIAAGYPPAMPPGFGQKLSEDDITSLIMYIKSLGEDGEDQQ